MPYCTQCAQALTEGSRFCGACGTAVAAPTAPAATAAAVTSGLTQQPTVASGGSLSSSSGQHGRFDPGTRLGTRYRIVALLGRGGMGEVYRADDLELGQSVALKFLPPRVATDAAELARFRNEVRIARMIAHPHVCRVYDIGEAEGHVFLSMEYIDGEDLASVLRRMGRPTPDKALELARQICLGLAAAHEAGMLHRDLKPANVMIDGRGRARITDFGLAGLADDLARGDQFAGTPAYMAPEQLQDGRVSVRSDVYALGLVFYELFTGRRAHDAGTLAELRHIHESGSITTPSDIARGIDPAVERLILHCLERDPESRPASAYAVLGALPGGDPLAAALAAGETPSPELVANARDRGGMSPLAAAGCVLLGLAGIGIWAGLLGPEYKPMTQPTQVLSVRAADLLQRTGSFATLPGHTADGFDLQQKYLTHTRKDSAAKRDRRMRNASAEAGFYWRRWSQQQVQAGSIHSEVPSIGDPVQVGAGEAVVMFDPEGRLIGLRAVPPDSVGPAHGGNPPWTVLWAASGLDTATFAPAPLALPVPAHCDSAAAWSGPVPWRGGEQVTVQMGASRGRLTHFSIVHKWGASTSPLDLTPVPAGGALEWMNMLVFAVLPLAASVYFGSLNLRLGRGDWRGATRIAVFVFVMNYLEALTTTRLSEVGLAATGWDLVAGRAFGHSLMHAVGMWFAYVALEPYVRRMWPQMLVGWTRLVSGRGRDPLVGRDLLIGVALGALLSGLSILVLYAAERMGMVTTSPLIGSAMIGSLTSLAYTGCAIAYGGSVCVLQTLETLVLIVLLRLVLRHTLAAVAVTFLLTAGIQAMGGSTDLGWPVAVVLAVIGSGLVLVLMRFGLLAAAVAALVGIVMSSTVGSFDLSSWYADRALVPMVLLLGLLLYGAMTALAGKSIFGDPLREGVN